MGGGLPLPLSDCSRIDECCWMYVPIGCPGCNEQLYVPLSLFQGPVLCPVCHRIVSVGVTDPRGRAAAAAGPPSTSPAGSSVAEEQAAESASEARPTAFISTVSAFTPASHAGLAIPDDIPLAEAADGVGEVERADEDIPILDEAEVVLEPAPVEAAFAEDPSAPAPSISDQVANWPDIDKVLVVLRRELKGRKGEPEWDLVDGRHVPQRLQRRRRPPGQRGRSVAAMPVARATSPSPGGCRAEPHRSVMLLLVLLFWGLPLWALVRPAGGKLDLRLVEGGLWAGVAVLSSGLGLLLTFARLGPRAVRMTVLALLFAASVTAFLHLAPRGGLRSFLPSSMREDWHAFQATDANFRASFPQPPHKEREAVLEEVGPDAWIEGTTYHAEGEPAPACFVVTRVRFYKEPAVPLSAHQKLGLVKNWFVRFSKGQLAAEEETRLSGYACKRLVITFTDPGLPHRKWEVRIVLAAASFYILQARDAGERDGARFFESFRLLAE